MCVCVYIYIYIYIIYLEVEKVPLTRARCGGSEARELPDACVKTERSWSLLLSLVARPNEAAIRISNEAISVVDGTGERTDFLITGGGKFNRRASAVHCSHKFLKPFRIVMGARQFFALFLGGHCEELLK